MKMRASVWLGVLLPLAIRAQIMPEAMDLLQRADGPIFTATTVRLTGTRERIIPAGRGTTSFSLERRNDGKTREEISAGADRTEILVFDGANTWNYLGVLHSYTQTPARTRLALPEFANLEYGRNPANVTSAEITGREQFAISGRMVDCDVVTAGYKGFATSATAKNVVRKVWISREQSLIVRDEWTFEVGASGAEHDIFNYTDTEWEIALGDDRFVFQPPPGSKLASTALPRVEQPVPIGKIEPEYTEEARAAGLQGTVTLFVWVDPDGTAQAQVLHGLGMGLDEKAVQAVERLRFTPGTVGGQPSRTGHTTDVNFHLEPAGPWRVRLAAYRVKQEKGRPPETLVKPVATRYTAPEAGACPASGGSTLVTATVGTDGRAESVRTETTGPLGAATAKAVESWRFQPGTADGKPREADASIEFECGPLPTVSGAANPGQQGLTNPTPIYKPEPLYTEAARQAKLGGTVVLGLVIDSTGHPTNLQILKPLGLGLDEMAAEAVTTWRFKPGMKGDQPVAVRAQIEVTFRLL